MFGFYITIRGNKVPEPLSSKVIVEIFYIVKSDWVSFCQRGFKALCGDYYLPIRGRLSIQPKTKKGLPNSNIIQ